MLKRKVQDIFKKVAQSLFKLFHGKIKHFNDDSIIKKLEKKNEREIIFCVKVPSEHATFGNNIFQFFFLAIN